MVLVGWMVQELVRAPALEELQPYEPAGRVVPDRLSTQSRYDHEPMDPFDGSQFRFTRETVTAARLVMPYGVS